jgi:hypothetical protein
MARVLGLVFSVCLLTAAVAGCGTSHPATPEGDCDDLVETVLCPRLEACGATYYSPGHCVATFESTAGNPLYCDTVTIEYSGVGACESDIDNAPCTYLVDPSGYGALPDSCVGIFN